MSADDDLADLDDWRDVRVIGNVRHDFLHMRPEACLEVFNGVAPGLLAYMTLTLITR